jgi:RNA polymerase sigma factor (TIGR02999 family)
MNEVTQILSAIEQGDTRAADQLFPLVYDALRVLAAAKLAHEAPGQTLQPTALAHEAYLKLVETTAQQWNSRGHFFAAVAEAMRRILVDRARKKHRVNTAADGSVSRWTRPTSWPRVEDKGGHEGFCK